MRARTVMVWIVAGCCAAPALAERAVTVGAPAQPDGEVSIELISGEVEIVGWERDEVKVTGTVGDDVEKVDVTSSGSRVSIEVKLPEDDSKHRSYDDSDAHLVIQVPATARLEAESVSADFTVKELRGTAKLESVSGRVAVGGAPREVEVSTVSGEIDVETAAPLQEGSFESVSGDIEIRGAIAKGGDWGLETVSGDITLHLPANASADFEVETFSGKIENALGPEPKRENAFVPGSSLTFSTGAGGARVEVESFSGRIRILSN